MGYRLGQMNDSMITLIDEAVKLRIYHMRKTIQTLDIQFSG